MPGSGLFPSLIPAGASRAHRSENVTKALALAPIPHAPDRVKFAFSNDTPRAEAMGPREIRILKQALSDCKSSIDGCLLFEPFNTSQDEAHAPRLPSAPKKEKRDLPTPLCLDAPIFLERGVELPQTYLFAEFLGNGLKYSCYPPLPSGLTLDCETGEFFGAPNVCTCETVSSLPPIDKWIITATNRKGRVVQRIQFQMVVLDPPPPFEYESQFSNYVLDKPINPNRPLAPAARFTHFSIDPALPDGLTLDDQGCISGVPTQTVRPTQFVVTACNPVGRAEALLGILVERAVPAFHYSRDAAQTLVGVPMADLHPFHLGPPAPGVYEVRPPLPAGLRLDRGSGAITGCPMEPTLALVAYGPAARRHAFHANRLPFTVRCANAVGQARAVLSLAAVEPPDLRASVGAATLLLGRFAMPILLEGPPPPGVRFAVRPRLPRGLVLNRCTGTISGIPRQICRDGSHFQAPKQQ